MASGWLAFAAALVVSPTALNDTWSSIRDLPLVLEGLLWLAAFPYLVGLAIWQASWDEGVRLIAIAMLALSYTLLFVPPDWKRRAAARGRSASTRPR
jgi:hypothetical protein